MKFYLAPILALALVLLVPTQAGEYCSCAGFSPVQCFDFFADGCANGQCANLGPRTTVDEACSVTCTTALYMCSAQDNAGNCMCIGAHMKDPGHDILVFTHNKDKTRVKGRSTDPLGVDPIAHNVKHNNHNNNKNKNNKKFEINNKRNIVKNVNLAPDDSNRWVIRHDLPTLMSAAALLVSLLTVCYMCTQGRHVTRAKGLGLYNSVNNDIGSISGGVTEQASIL